MGNPLEQDPTLGGPRASTLSECRGDTLDTLKCHKASRKIIQFKVSERKSRVSRAQRKRGTAKGKGVGRGEKGEGNVSSLASRLEIATLEPNQDQAGAPFAAISLSLPPFFFLVACLFFKAPRLNTPLMIVSC